MSLLTINGCHVDHSSLILSMGVVLSSCSQNNSISNDALFLTIDAQHLTLCLYSFLMSLQIDGQVEIAQSASQFHHPFLVIPSSSSHQFHHSFIDSILDHGASPFLYLFVVLRDRRLWNLKSGTVMYSTLKQ